MRDRSRNPAVRLPPVGDVSPWQRSRLALEILGHYLPLLRSLRRNGLATVLAEARAPDRRALTSPAGAEHETAMRLGSIVGQVLGPLPTDNRCLIRALVLMRLLARRGIDAELVIGVRVGKRFAAHAWVEHGAEPLLPVGDFEPLSRL